MKFSGLFVSAVLASTAVAIPLNYPRANNNNSTAVVAGKNATAVVDNKNSGKNSTAKPVAIVKDNKKNNNNKQAKAANKAAAYFLTNEPSGNFIVSMNIGNDGKLTLAKATPTGGDGSHGKEAGGEGPDALFSQGSIKVSRGQQGILAANAGSSTISLFKIDPQNPGVPTLVNEPISSGGEFPMSVAWAPDGKTACVLNGGAVNGVQCYNVDMTNGLSEIKNTQRSLGLKLTTPPSGPGSTVSNLKFLDAEHLVASVKGDGKNSNGFMAVWNINQQDHSLSNDFVKVDPPAAGSLPFGFNFVPAGQSGNKNVALVADAGRGFDVIDLSDAVNGKVQPKGEVKAAASKFNQAIKVAGQGAVCWTARAKTTGNFFLTDILTSQITEVKVDSKSLKASIVKQYAQPNGTAPTDDATAHIQNKDFLYVLAPGKTSVNVFDVTASGKANQVQSLDISGPAKKVGLTLSTNQMQGMAAFF